MDSKSALCCAGVIIIFAVIGFIMITGDDTTTTDIIEPTIIYDSHGKISPESSDLTLYYNNDESVYGYYLNDVFQTIAYYNDADIKGKIVIDLTKAKWSKKYDPSDASTESQKHVNNISHTKDNFLNDIQKDYDNGNLTMNAYLSFKKENGDFVKDLYSISDFDGIKLNLKDGILKLKVKHKFNTNNTIISNDIPYDGALSQNQSDFDKTAKAYITLSFKGEDYDYELTSTLKGDNFYIVHT